MSTQPKDLQFAVLAVDVVIFTYKDGKLLVRLSNVNRPPYFKNIPGFPGGLMKPEETAEETARRIIRDRAAIEPSHVYLEQLYTFSEVNRDPRGRVVSVGYIACIPWEKLTEEEQRDSKEIWWREISIKEHFAYDHTFMLDKALTHLRSFIRSTTICFKLLPSAFTLTTLENLFETVLNEHIDKRNFRKKVQKLKVLKSLKQKTVGMKHRPAELFGPQSSSVLEISLF